MRPLPGEPSAAGHSVLVQFLLPLRDAQGQPFPADTFAAIRSELTESFGGVTAYLHSPAKGAWLDASGHLERDDMILVEVMAADLDRHWWGDYRARLERMFQQDRVLVRAMNVDAL